MPRIGHEDCGCGHGVRAHSGSDNGAFTSGPTRKHYAPDLLLEPTHLEVSLDFDVPNSRVAMKVVHTITCRNPIARGIDLNGVGFANVKVVDGDGKPLSFFYDGELIKIAWDLPFSVGEQRRAEVSYLVDHPITGMFFSSPDAVYRDRPVFAITDNETERARYWLASVDAPSVRPTLMYHISVPEGYTVLANGKETSRSSENGRLHVTFDQPHRTPAYLACVAVGKFVSFTDTPGPRGIPIAYYAPENVDPKHLALTFNETPGIMAFLEKRFGVPFPFPEKYSQVVCPYGGGFSAGEAMENTTLTTWDTYWLCDELWAQDFKIWTDRINLHEMTHSYFGDSLVIRHYDQVWLKESWASYMEPVWAGERFGLDEHRYQLFLKSLRYREEAKKYVRPIVEKEYEHSWQLYDDHTYPGGAWRIHMLRRILGEDRFWGGVKEYLTTYAGQVVETDDFRKILERHSGLNLTKYFDQWFFSRGYPIIDVRMSFDVQTKLLTLKLDQVQVDAAKRIGLFDLRVPIVVLDANKNAVTGVAEFSDTASATVTFALSSTPISIEVDPNDDWLIELNFNPGTSVLEYVLKNSSNVTKRIWAAIGLIKTGSKAAFDLVREALLKDPFYAVQMEIARELGKTSSPYVAPLLIDALDHVKNARALNEVVVAMRNGDPQYRAALLKFVERSDLSYKPRATAFEAIGKIMDPSDLEVLKSAVGKYMNVGYMPIVVDGALRGLGYSRNVSALPFLLSSVAYGKLPEFSRPAAISALGELAGWVSDNDRLKIEETLILLIQERSVRTHKAVIDSLVAMKSKAAIQPIESSKARISHQDRVVVNHQLDSLRALPTESGSDRQALVKLQLDLATLQQQLRDKFESVK